MNRDFYIKKISTDKDLKEARFLLAPSGEIIACNSYAAKLFGYKNKSEIIGKSYKELVPEEFAISLPDTISTDYLTKGEYLPRINRCADGSLIPTLILTKYVYLDNECYVETLIKNNYENITIGELRYEQLSEILQCELFIIRNKHIVCNKDHINTQLQLQLEEFCLSIKEIQFCSLLHSGMHSKEISDILGLSISSIYTFRKRLRKKLNLKQDTDLFRYLHRLTKTEPTN